MDCISFDEVRRLQYDMLKEVDTFCRQNGLSYFMAYGTLLGAVRHNGFIPWDDDIDVMMPEPDLEAFCRGYSSDRYIIVNAFTDRSHNLVFPKMYDKRTCSFWGDKVTFGVGIDLYGIYGLPSSLYIYRDYIYNFFKLWNQRKHLSSIRKYLIKTHLWPNKSLDFGALNKSVKKGILFQKEYPYYSSKLCMIDTRPVTPIDKRIFETSVELQFEGGSFFAPTRYDELLTLIYGDYMQLPPIEQRKPYHEYNCFWTD